MHKRFKLARFGQLYLSRSESSLAILGQTGTGDDKMVLGSLLTLFQKRNLWCRQEIKLAS